MAGRWLPNPADPIGKKESIGRRLFDEPTLVGATDQRPREYLDYRHFEERRAPIEVSFDRLGANGVDGKVRRYLEPIAIQHGIDWSAKKFDGWVWLKADKLTAPPKGPPFPLTPSPIRLAEPAHPECNPYHAHTACPPTADAHGFTLALQYLFSTHGKMLECNVPRPPFFKRILLRLKRFSRSRR